MIYFCCKQKGLCCWILGKPLLQCGDNKPNMSYHTSPSLNTHSDPKAQASPGSCVFLRLKLTLLSQLSRRKLLRSSLGSPLHCCINMDLRTIRENWTTFLCCMPWEGPHAKKAMKPNDILIMNPLDKPLNSDQNWPTTVLRNPPTEHPQSILTTSIAGWKPSRCPFHAYEISPDETSPLVLTVLQDAISSSSSLCNTKPPSNPQLAAHHNIICFKTALMHNKPNSCKVNCKP